MGADSMKRFIEGADRTQVSLLPGCADDYVGTDNPVRVIEAIVGPGGLQLNLARSGHLNLAVTNRVRSDVVMLKGIPWRRL